jgi:DNA polymerase III subunit epsilon
MNDTPEYTFVDVETTGMSPTYDRIIEIGLIRVKANKIVRSYETVINPRVRLPPEITTLTGIRASELVNAPTFRDIAEIIHGYLTDSVFVAHNARFDYRFLVEEFRRIGTPFRNDTLCTVRLFRNLYPGRQSYSLDALIETFEIKMKRRHRAFDDARALWDFFRIIRKHHDEDTVRLAIDTVMRRPSFPPGLTRESIERLPDAPGVYVFRGNGEIPLYIGKAKNIRDRVISHFHDTETKELSIASQITAIDTIRTSGELAALILEKQMVADMKPVYNRRLKAGIHRLVLLEDQVRGYKTVEIADAKTVTTETYDRVLGIYSSKRQVASRLDDIATAHELCPKLLGIDQSSGSCFRHALKKCRGACVEREIPIRYNMRFAQAFADLRIKKWPFPGPVVLYEETDGMGRAFVADKWSILGQSEPGGLPEIDREYAFDPDMYSILKRFLMGNRQPHNLRIIPFTESSDYPPMGKFHPEAGF